MLKEASVSFFCVIFVERELIMRNLEGMVAVLGMLVLVGLLLALPTMLLWNWLMPDLFGTPSIGFWQALGLYLLSSSLFKTTVNKK